ncbi:PAS domain S-box protein [bacterium]|nr:PAS domain S-box protein [bacterium]
MNIIAVLDLLSLLTVLAAILLVIRSQRSGFIFCEIRIVVLGLLGFSALYHFFLFLEWTGITTRLDRIEDLIGALIPMWWAFVFYAILKSLAAHDLQKSQERYRMLIETMNEAFATIDIDGRFTSVNQKMELMLGYPKKELIGVFLKRFLDEANQEIIDDRLIKTQNYVPSSSEHEWIRKDGSRVVTYMSPQSLFENEIFVGSFAVFLDITDRKKAEEALQDSEEKYRNVAQNATVAICVIQDEMFALPTRNR